jgi:hypothetical protein
MIIGTCLFVCEICFGTFAKLQKVTISCVMFVCMDQLGSNWMDFYEILYLITFKKSDENIQVSLASDKNNGYCT